MNAIELSGLTKRYGSFIAVDRLDLAVPAGRIFGLLGPNGCGKTTCLRMICGLLTPSAGGGSVLDLDIRTRGEEIRSQLGYMPQLSGLYDDLTVRENLRFMATLYGLPSGTISARLNETMALLDLTALAGERIAALSAGVKRRLALAAALIHQPRLLLLDEPTSGVDPGMRRQFWAVLQRLASEGRTVLVTTHHLDEAEYCHRVAIMRQGRVLVCDSPPALRRSLSGELWEIETAAWAETARRLEAYDHYLHGKRIRVWLPAGADPKDLRGLLPEDSRLNQAEPGLEDVFLRLAKGSEKPIEHGYTG